MYYVKYLLAMGVAVVLGLLGCTTPTTQTIWPEPRPLGKEVPTYQPPVQPTGALTTVQDRPELTGELTLSQAQAQALQYSPELAVFGWEVRAREARTVQAGLRPNPEVGLEVENVVGTGELQGFDAGEITIFFSHLIEVAGKRLKRARVAALERDLAAWDYETTRLDVLTRVTQAFVEVLSAQERLAVNQELVRLAEQVLATVAARVNAGKVSPVQETRAKVELSTSRIAREQARRELEADRELLVAVWGGTSPAFEHVEGSLESITAIPSAAALAQRIAQNPDIARWMTEMVQRQAAVELEEAGRLPDPTLGGGFRYFNETRDSAFVMEFSIPLPVFDRNQGNIQEARYRLAKAREERRTAEVQVRAALGETYAALSAAFAEATALKDEVLPGAQQAFDAINEGYRQGKFGFLDVLDAQRTLFEARSQYINALAAYHTTVAEVERLIGEPLDSVKNTSAQQ